MRYLIFLFIAVIIFPMNGFCQSGVAGEKMYVAQRTLNDIESNEYRSFLKEMRKTDKKREFVDYKEDRDTRYRKLEEEIDFEQREAYLAGQRAWEGRMVEAWDKRMSYIDKGYSASTDRESSRAFKAARQLRPPSRSSIDVYRR
ncbi:MAG TPA: hypothetical protein PLX02_13990 [Syntrophorhabdaceae bacterium]|nr:hypothetical protein [Syntrophorhabdaceae bacterium]HQM82720.1 hypothetical protein [Syntrophorhabdaceae bacterium]